MKLNAKNLKENLWQVLQGLRKGEIEPVQAEAIASQSREIIRVVKTQQNILKQARQDVTKDMIDFVTDVEQ